MLTKSIAILFPRGHIAGGHMKRIISNNEWYYVRWTTIVNMITQVEVSDIAAMASAVSVSLVYSIAIVVLVRKLSPRGKRRQFTRSLQSSNLN